VLAYQRVKGKNDIKFFIDLNFLLSSKIKKVFFLLLFTCFLLYMYNFLIFFIKLLKYIISLFNALLFGKIIKKRKKQLVIIEKELK